MRKKTSDSASDIGREETFKYNPLIPALPTKYRGRQYRSRLEARWAAFLDLAGLSYEYEPVDLGTWSPDFAIWGKYSSNPVLAEVKPISSWDRATARKISDAVSKTDAASFILLLGKGPQTTLDCPILGWFGQISTYETMWTEAVTGRDSTGRFDINPSDARFDLSTVFWGLPETATPYPANALWTEAANIIQWKGPRKPGLESEFRLEEI